MAVQVVAPITGTVWEVKVALGQQVAEEQVVVVLESMKMEVPVEAPVGGVVSAIVAQKGQSVEEGEALITLTE